MIRNLGLALTLALELGSGMGRFGCTYVESVTAWYLRNKNNKQFNPWPCALNSITYHKASLLPSSDESASKPLPTARIVQEGRTIRIPAHSHHNERARHTVAFSAAMAMLTPSPPLTSHPIPSTAGAVLKKTRQFHRAASGQHDTFAQAQLNSTPDRPCLQRVPGRGAIFDTNDTEQVRIADG